MNATAPRLLRFGLFELDLEREHLRRNGATVKLHTQPFRLLAAMALRSDELMTRDEIRQTVWEQDTFVDFDQGINTCIRQIRQALGDSADRPRFVQTVPRRGYRFLGPVEQVQPATPHSTPHGGDEPTESPVPVPTAGRSSTIAPRAQRRRRGWVLLGAISASLLWLAIGWLGGSSRLPKPAFGSDDALPVVAILPFADLSVDTEQSYLGDALTEELIAQLGRRYAQRMAIIARTSAMHYKQTDKTIAQIADELGADYVLEGSVRRAGSPGANAGAGSARVTAQLIRADDSSHMWASSYEHGLDDPLAMQVEIGERIAAALALKILPDALGSDPLDPLPSRAAYATYLSGLEQLASDDRQALIAATQTFERVIQQDPSFAPAYVGLARALTRSDPSPESQDRTRQALQRAIDLDDELASAHLAMANHRFYRDFDFDGARRGFERALELQPDLSEAHHAIAAVHSITGNHDRAIAAVQQARRLDPRSSMVRSDVGWYYYFAREYALAEQHCLRTLDLDPGFYWAELCIQLSMVQRGDWTGLALRGERLIAAWEPDAPELERLRARPATQDSQALWRWRLRRMQPLIDQGAIPRASTAQLHMVLGDTDAALQALEHGFETRTGWLLPFLAVDPLFDELRGDSRFEDLLGRVHGG